MLPTPVPVEFVQGGGESISGDPPSRFRTATVPEPADHTAESSATLTELHVRQIDVV